MSASAASSQLPTPSSNEQQPSITATESPFPVPSKTSFALISNIPTTVTRLSFADKILLTISQSGRLNHWLHVPLLGDSPLTDPSTYITPAAPSEEDRLDASLLPFPHLTATTVLGGTKPEFEVLGLTLATTVASAVLMKTPGEQRMVVFGLGLEKGSVERGEFEELVGLCLDVL